ncbi:DUF1345 domain-containing protein [soil metagenome]
MHRHRSIVRFVVMIVGGTIAGLIAGALGAWVFAPTIGWAVAALIYCLWVWIAVGHFDGETTAAHATGDEPARGRSDALILVLTVASLASLVIVLGQASSVSGIHQALIAALAVVSVALSWTLLHTLFALRYARLYYRTHEGGVDFNQKERPQYSDFAYLSFTLGMTYQVSDTDISNKEIRATALRHTLLSFVFGAVIVATTVNLVAGLG